MKQICFKALLLMGCFVAAINASAQFSLGANANYTMYKGSFQQSTPGFQVRAGYGVNEKATAVLGFTYGLPINTPSTVNLSSSSGSKSIASEIRYNFKTVSLMGQYNFVGNEETAGKFYGMAGAGLVFVGYKEEAKESYDKNTYTATDLMEPGNESGFTINLGLGGEYKVGAPIVFAEAGLALPANQQNGQYVENNIPAHFILNVGLKFTFGGNDY